MNLAERTFEEDPNPFLTNSFAEAHLDIRDHLGQGIYLLKNGDLGTVWEISGIYDEIMESDDLQEALAPIQKALRNVLAGIPSHENRGNTAVQVICSTRKATKPPAKVVDGMPYSFSDSLAGQFLAAEEKYLFKSLNFIDRRFFLTLRYTPIVDDRGLWQKAVDYVKDRYFLDLFRNNQVFESEVAGPEAQLKRFGEELDRLEGILKEQGDICRLLPRELMEYVQDVLNGNTQRPIYESSEDIHLAINTPNLKVDSNHNIIGLNREKTEVYYLDQLPKDYSYGIFKHFMDQIPHTNYDIVLNLTYGANQVRPELKSREGYFSSRSSREAEAFDFRSFRQQVSTFNPYATQSLRLLVHNPPAGFASRLQSAASDYIGCHMPKEVQIPVHMLVTSLPLGATRRGNGLKGRSRTIRLDAALGFLPIYTGPQRASGVVQRPSRGMTPTSFDLMAGDGNKMTVAIGTSRSGKSVFTNQFALEFLERFPNGVIFGSDVRTSYLKLADLCGGRVVQFSEKELRNDPYSPFALEAWDEADMENLKYLISMVIAAKNPEAGLSDIHSNIIKQAIHLAYNSHRKLIIARENGEIQSEISAHPTWEKIVSQFPEAKKELEKSGTGNLNYAVEDIQKWTISLTKSGEYGFIFSEKQNRRDSDYTERVLIYDMDGIEDPILKQIASMMANMKIMRAISILPRNIRKLIVFDELGQQVRGTEKQNASVSHKAQEIMGEMMINIVATAAKMNAQVIALTNQVTDYTENPAGRALWSISEQQVFLPLGKLFKRAKTEWGSDYNEAEWEIIRSLRKEKSYRRSALYVSSNNDTAPFKGSVYLPLSPWMDALTTTSGPQTELYKKLRNQGMSAFDAIEFMAEKHPYGQNLGNEKEEIELNDGEENIG